MRESEDGVRGDVTPADARAALDAVDRAKAHVVDEVGLPRWYWWLLAAGWVVIGLIGDVGPQWLVIGATVGFGVVHSAIAAAVALHADGARHPGIAAAVFVAAIVGLGGPEILRTLRRWVRA